MNIKYQKLNRQDLRLLTDLIDLYKDVFEMQEFTIPNSGHLQKLLESESIIFYTAISEDVIVGGLTAHILPSTYFPSAEVYIYDLAVKTQYQRKGIGRQLIASLKDCCTKLGMKEIFVQADLEDKHAIDFYEATGGIAERVIHFSYELSNKT